MAKTLNIPRQNVYYHAKWLEGNAYVMQQPIPKTSRNSHVKYKDGKGKTRYRKRKNKQTSKDHPYQRGYRWYEYENWYKSETGDDRKVRFAVEIPPLENHHISYQCVVNRSNSKELTGWELKDHSGVPTYYAKLNFTWQDPRGPQGHTTIIFRNGRDKKSITIWVPPLPKSANPEDVKIFPEICYARANQVWQFLQKTYGFRLGMIEKFISESHYELEGPPALVNAMKDLGLVDMSNGKYGADRSDGKYHIGTTDHTAAYTLANLQDILNHLEEGVQTTKERLSATESKLESVLDESSSFFDETSQVKEAVIRLAGIVEQKQSNDDMIVTLLEKMVALQSSKPREVTLKEDPPGKEPWFDYYA